MKFKILFFFKLVSILTVDAQLSLVEKSHLKVRCRDGR